MAKVLEDRKCSECPTVFTPIKYNQKICCHECRKKRTARLDQERREKKDEEPETPAPVIYEASDDENDWDPRDSSHNPFG